MSPNLFPKSFSDFEYSFSNYIRRPILAPILKDRTACIVISTASILQATLTAFWGTGWSCPFRNYLGCPCPGCGMTRGVIALLSGDWQMSVTYHAFAPLLLLALLSIGLVTILPDPIGRRITNTIWRWEEKTGLTAIMLLALVVYWAIRFFLFQEAFFALVYSD